MWELNLYLVGKTAHLPLQKPNMQNNSLAQTVKNHKDTSKIISQVMVTGFVSDQLKS